LFADFSSKGISLEGEEGRGRERKGEEGKELLFLV